MAKKFLITGVTGSGKTTLEKIFRGKGYHTADIDEGFAEWRNKITGQVEDYQPNNPEWHKNVIWALRAEVLRARLDSVDDEPILVFGSANDLYEHVNLFDKVYVLEYPDEDTVKLRLASRIGNHYGKTNHEVEAALAYYKDYQDQMKQLGAQAISCALPLEDIVHIIESEVSRE